MKRDRQEIESIDCSETIHQTNPVEKRNRTSSAPSHPLCGDFVEVVFQFLPPEDLFYTIPFVCSHWRHLFPKLDNILWKKFCPQKLLCHITETKDTNTESCISLAAETWIILNYSRENLLLSFKLYINKLKKEKISKLLQKRC